jgi:8-oxo-dGTP pyrophosphatase MutT (NUDIX family)
LRKKEKEMKDFKVLHSESNFEVVEVAQMVGLKYKTMTIAIMPYTVDENGLVLTTGFLKEYNPFRQGDYAFTLITGTVEDQDEDLINTAIRELKEEGGITCSREDISRWIYLGNFYPYKNSDLMIPTFAVDVTGLEIKEPKGDGSAKEEKSSFEMIPVSEAITSDETLPLAAFLRLFNYFYSKTVDMEEK